jgi:hypothetical protein
LKEVSLWLSFNVEDIVFGLIFVQKTEAFNEVALKA